LERGLPQSRTSGGAVQLALTGRFGLGGVQPGSHRRGLLAQTSEDMEARPDQDASATDPSAKFDSPAKLQAAVERLPIFEDKTQLSTAVMAFVAEQVDVAIASGKPPLVLIAERHRRNNALAIQMSAMKAIHDKLGRGGTVMFEMSPARVEKLERHVLLFQDRMPPDESPEALLAADRKLDDMLNDQDPPLRAAWHLAAKAYVSQELGFDFTAFDIRRHQPMPERESGMVEAIRNGIN